MIKLANILSEVNLKIDTPDAIYTWEKKGKTLYYFETESKTKYIVSFGEYGEAPLIKYERSYRPVGKAFRQMTGEGKALKINLTVTAITLDFLKTTPKWDEITITPINEKRANLVKLLLDINISDQYNVEENEGIIYITKKYE